MLSLFLLATVTAGKVDPSTMAPTSFGLASHEHPFLLKYPIDAGTSQKEGDKLCVDERNSLILSSVEYYGTDPEYNDFTYKPVLALDGHEIGNSALVSNIWYHREKQICVANTNSFVGQGFFRWLFGH
jgi:hypothetical protein